MACYILGIKAQFRIVNGFIRRVWRKFAVHKIIMLENGVFMVKFHTIKDNERELEAGPILYDSKPVIVKRWTPKLDITLENVKVVPTWTRFRRLLLKYWGQSST